MVSLWSLCLLVIATVEVGGTEVAIPERYLQPRHYNPHPLQTLLSGNLLLNIPRDVPGPTASPVNRQEEGSPVQFPTVPEAARPTKSQTPGYITVPKNYAFAYAVKDRQSGDDFSHQQAQNGEATKGEYRVKLPDGRTQIVSYTADSSGYKAEVTYEGQASPQPAEYKQEGVSYKSDYSRYQAEPPRYHNPDRILYKPPSINYQTGRLLYKTAQPRYQSDNLGSFYKQPSPVYKTDTTSYQGHYPSVASNSIIQETDYPEEPEIDYRQPLQLVQKYAQSGLEGTPRPLGVLFSPSATPTGLQYRAIPQTAGEYTSSDAPLYVATPSPTPGHYAPPVSSTTATPITENQEDVPATRKSAGAVPYPPSSYYSVSTPRPPSDSAVRYIFVPHPTQYVYSDS